LWAGSGIDQPIGVHGGAIEAHSPPEIRDKKALAENRVARKKKTKQDLEKGIRNDMALLQGARARVQTIQKRIEGHKRTLATLAEMDAMQRRLAAGRAKEEKAFLQFYRVIEKMRKELKAP
jgi:hypothetical protein